MLRSTRIPHEFVLSHRQQTPRKTWAVAGFRGMIAPRQFLTPPSLHANHTRQRLRYGLSRDRPRAAAGLHPRDAGRLPHLVGGTRTAVKNPSRDLGEPEAFFSRTLGRARRRLPDGATRCRRDRVYRETGYGAGGPDGAFPGRAHFVQGCRAAA